LSVLRESDLAPGLLLGDGVQLGEGVRLGGHVVIHEGTRVGDRAVIQDGAIVGKSAALGPRSTAPRHPVGPAVVGEHAAVLAGAVMFAGAELGPGAILGDQAQLRERARVGPESVIGRGTAVDNNLEIGARVRIQANCYLAARTVIEDDVFVGPGVTTTNDNTMARHGPADPVPGPKLRRASRIGGGAVICPGVEVGEEAFVAAGAVVVGDVPPRGVVMGVPARLVREVPDEDLLERWYPSPGS
jgi:UDP-2-acetamido-3-amino-2,3-dideoxy-glucuronate N-acetyltransferase